MKNIFIILTILLYSCKTEIVTNSYNASFSTEKQKVKSKAKAPIVKSNTVFYFVRHAETVGDGKIVNPDLSITGRARAEKWVTYFKEKKIDSIFTTNFKRTLQTIIPVAKSKGITPIYYNPSDIDYANFIKQNKGKNILIVGHSNTTPNFVNKLIGSMKYSQMVDENHSDIFKVIVGNNNNAVEEVFVLEEELAKIAAVQAKLDKKNKKRKKK